MAGKAKEKKNCEKQFALLYKNKRISGNADLLRRMYREYYREYYKEKNCEVSEEQIWVNSKEADLRNMIIGKRPFTESHIKAIERALNMSWVDIVDPLPESKKKEKEFEAGGLRYAAYLDKEWYYQELADCYDVENYQVALCNEGFPQQAI